MGRKSRYYDSAFKSEAVRLVLSEGRSVSDVERSLGITRGVLKSWVSARRIEAEEGRSPSSYVSETDSPRVRQLEKELARVRMERDILKKAVAVFSKDQDPYSGSYSSTAPSFR